MQQNGALESKRKKMQKFWQDHHQHSDGTASLVPYKTTSVIYQGSYEFDFLQTLETEHGLEWIEENVSRGPTIRYVSPADGTERVYLSDFIIGDTIYEIKSSWTWDHHGTNQELAAKNKAKLDECIAQGYTVILVLDKEKKTWH